MTHSVTQKSTHLEMDKILSISLFVEIGYGITGRMLQKYRILTEITI